MAATTVAFSDLASYLSGLADNTADTPYELDITGLTDDVMYCSDANTLTEGTLRYVLRNNSTKYVSIVFSSTGLTAANAHNGLYGCTNIVSVTGTSSKLVLAPSLFSKCTNLKTVENLRLPYLTNARTMFSDCTSLESVQKSLFPKVTDAYGMFLNCHALKSIDFGAFPAVQDAVTMCGSCQSLKTVDISGMSRLTDAESMFQNCTSLKSVTITGLGAAATANYMFAFCTSLETADIQGLSSVTKARYMFRNCTSLAEITNWSMDADKLTSYTNIFADCPSTLKIHLPDTRKTHSAFRLVRVRADSSGNVTVRARGTSDTAAQDTTLAASIGSALRLKGQIDEIATAAEITDAQFTKMIERRYKWSASGNGTLDPDASSLVLWAKDPAAVKSNFLSDVVVNDALTLTDSDFDEIFS